MKLFEQAKKIAQGAAMMTNTTCDVDVLSAVWPLRANRTVAELVQRNMEAGRHAGMDRGGGRARARAAGQRQGQGRRAARARSSR